MLKVCRSATLSSRLKCCFSRWYSPFPMDTANVMGMINAKEPIMSLSEKCEILTPSYIYTSMDTLSRQILFTLANDLELGVALGILTFSTLVRLTFLHINIKSQINMRSPYFLKISKAYKQRAKIAQQSNSKEMLAQAKYAFDIAKKKRRINLLLPMWNIFQVPFLITWFLSLRYMSNLPEVYTILPEGGWLWFKDLTTYDPYFILPLVSACFSSYAIILNPTLANNNENILAKYSSYLKYMPFLSLAFTAFFPSTLLLYWMNISFIQVLNVKLASSSTVQKIYNNPEQFFRRTTKNEKKFLAAQFKREFSEGLCIDPNNPIFRPVKRVRDLHPKIMEMANVRQSKQRLSARKALAASFKENQNRKKGFSFSSRSTEVAPVNRNASRQNWRKLMRKYRRACKRRQIKLEKEAKEKLVCYKTPKPAPKRPLRTKRTPVVIPEIPSFKTAFPKPLNPKTKNVLKPVSPTTAPA